MIMESKSDWILYYTLLLLSCYGSGYIIANIAKTLTKWHKKKVLKNKEVRKRKTEKQLQEIKKKRKQSIFDW